MKKIFIATVLLVAATGLQAQERVSREECLKYAFAATANLKEMLKTPIPTDPDVKRAVAVRDGEFGGMILPEGKLTADVLAKCEGDVVAVGQLWLHKLAPMSGNEPVAASKLRKVHVSGGDHEADVPCCALGARKSANGNLELLIYGNDKEPVVKVPMKSISATQENPIEISAERKDEGGLVTLRLVGKYEASFMVTAPEE